MVKRTGTVSQGSMWKECLDVPDLPGNLKLNQEIPTSRGTCALDENSVQGVWGLVCLCDHEPSAIRNPLKGPGDFLPFASNDQGSLGPLGWVENNYHGKCPSLNSSEHLCVSFPLVSSWEMCDKRKWEWRFPLGQLLELPNSVTPTGRFLYHHIVLARG